MASNLLFLKQDIYRFVEAQQQRLKAAYEQLPDEDALDSIKNQELKSKFGIMVPALLRNKIEYESNERQVTANQFLGRNILGVSGQALRDVVEYTFHVPFEGDAFVFDIAPSASNGTAASGEVVGQEVLVRFQVADPNINPENLLEEALSKIEWRLSHLRGSTEYLNQQLNITLANCIAARKRAIETHASMATPLRFAKRAPAAPPVGEDPPSAVVSARADLGASSTSKWDIFISHASPDKPYVRQLVAALRKEGITVWFDEDTIGWGESLRPAINKGLLRSGRAIVLLSKPFLAQRKWTEHELNGLFAREKVGDFVILPIWHGIEHEDLVNYDPALADRLAKVSATDAIPEIVRSALQALGRAPVDVPPLPRTDAEVQLSDTPHKLRKPQPRAKRMDQEGRKGKTTSSNAMTIEEVGELSPKEIELLWNAVKDPDGEIIRSVTFDGESLASNERHFLEGVDRRAAAEWLTALRSLEDRGLVEALSEERDLFQVTGEGYAVADELQDFAQWRSRSVTLRAFYMNAEPEELTLPCERVVVIPAKYYPDQVGADARVSRSVRDRKALLVEGVRAMPEITWDPTDVEFAIEGTQEMVQFRIDGLTYLRSGALKLPIVE